jgi:hypothetical protein
MKKHIDIVTVFPLLTMETLILLWQTVCKFRHYQITIHVMSLELPFQYYVDALNYKIKHLNDKHQLDVTVSLYAFRDIAESMGRNECEIAGDQKRSLFHKFLKLQGIEYAVFVEPNVLFGPQAMDDILDKIDRQEPWAVDDSFFARNLADWDANFVQFQKYKRVEYHANWVYDNTAVNVINGDLINHPVFQVIIDKIQKIYVDGGMPFQEVREGGNNVY